MNLKEFKRKRATVETIGGTDTAMLFSNTKSKTEAFYRKIGLMEPIKQTPLMAIGNFMESRIADLWCYYDENPDAFVSNIIDQHKVRWCLEVQSLSVNPQYPFMHASIDRLITKSYDAFGDEISDGVLEIKFGLPENYISQEISQEGILDAYTWQVLHYLAVTGKTYAEIFRLSLNCKATIHYITLTEEIKNLIIERAYDYYISIKKAKEILKNSFGDVNLLEISPEDKAKAIRLVRHLEPEEEMFSQAVENAASFINDATIETLNDDQIKLIQSFIGLHQQSSQLNKAKAKLKRMMNDLNAQRIVTPQCTIRFKNGRMTVKYAKNEK